MMPREEFEIMKRKADLYDNMMDDEELTPEELAQVENATKKTFMTYEDFLKKHPELRDV